MSLIVDFIRHGDTGGGGSFRGLTDDPLLPQGWAQLEAQVSRHQGWTRIISSPRRRCQEFARQLGQQRGLPVDIEDGFAELGFGDWEGRTPAELMQNHAGDLERFWVDPYAYTPPHGESLCSFSRRIHAALERLLQQPAEDASHLLVVTHAGVIRLLLAEARNLPRAQLLQIPVDYADLFRLSLTATPEGIQLRELPCSPS